ncbi:hypothetical protein VTN31DRAFT_1664 [Thermomyces dupontii]|uniref:uncharacterized protein n=1 Tax=Talaromyces thermophilus TaxID=28565 RepID=UPI0037421B31
MGTKRSSPSSDIDSEPHGKLKRAKKHAESRERDSVRTVDSTSTSETKRVIDLLGQLTTKVANSPRSAKHFKDDARRILQAAEKLQQEISRANNGQIPDSSADEHSIYSKNGTLPPLPPISDKALEKAVFTHPGVARPRSPEQLDETSYDRLEILGDAYLEMMATRIIWDRFPTMPAGRISQVREELIKNETLAEFASQYGFDNRVLAPQEHRTQPKRWTKTRADVFEAYVAAIILSDASNGYQIAQDWMLQLWKPRLSQFKAPQTRLQSKELLAKKIMGKGVKLNYVEEKPMEMLSGGTQRFFIGVYLTGWGWHNQHLGSGSGSSKAIAGEEAAQKALANTPLIDEIAAVKQAHISKTATKDNDKV